MQRNTHFGAGGMISHTPRLLSTAAALALWWGCARPACADMASGVFVATPVTEKSLASDHEAPVLLPEKPAADFADAEPTAVFDDLKIAEVDETEPDSTALPASLNSELQSPAAVPRTRHHTHRCRHRDRWSFTAMQTTDYVTNLALPFALTPNNASVLQNDAQFQTLFSATYRLAGNDKRNLTASYIYYSSLHPVVNTLNLMNQGILFRYTNVVNERVKTSLDYDYTYYFLESKPFVSRHRVGGKLLLSPTQKYDWQFGADFSHNTFFQLTPTDTVTPTLTSYASSGRAEYIRYLNTRDNFLTFGYAYGRNDALSNSWTYNVYSGYVTGRFKGPRKNELIVLGSYALYDFQSFDVIQTTTIRHDHIYTVSAKFTHPINDRVGVFALYQFYDALSNIIRQNYDSHLVSLGVQATW